MPDNSTIGPGVIGNMIIAIKAKDLTSLDG